MCNVGGTGQNSKPNQHLKFEKTNCSKPNVLQIQRIVLETAMEVQSIKRYARMGTTGSFKTKNWITLIQTNSRHHKLAPKLKMC
jgi:hypothetical protein